MFVKLINFILKKGEKQKKQMSDEYRGALQIAPKIVLDYALVLLC
jgi:hypothetical protein